MNELSDAVKVAVLYQAMPSPMANGIVKPMKPGGYADSGADIAFALRGAGTQVITPVPDSSVDRDLDWVFPDSADGISRAVSLGADTLWLNTVLYAGHPVEEAILQGVYVVGQRPSDVDKYDDKWITNNLLRARQLPIPDAILVTHDTLHELQIPFEFPVVAKPIRGRGSEGVTMANDFMQLSAELEKMFAADRFGTAVCVEAYLPGEELTITVMPPGEYSKKDGQVTKSGYWSLPPVRRFNHANGIAPYNGVVAVINNSAVLSDDELISVKIANLCRQCERAAAAVGAKAPIRIDCRADASGKYFLFDLNMKPNMTGAARPSRQDQDSLSTLAARKIGWSFTDLLLNMLNHRWR